MNDTPTESAAAAAGLPLPAATRLLALLACDEPNNPFADGPTLAGLIDEQLAPGLREWAAALEHAAAKLIRHEATSSDVVPNRLEHLAALLARAGDQAEFAGSEIRGQMRPFPWRPPGAPLPSVKPPGLSGDEPDAERGDSDGDGDPPGSSAHGGADDEPAASAGDAGAPCEGAGGSAETGAAGHHDTPAGEREPPDDAPGAGPAEPEEPV